jgi:mono/diheme cytochrome c family protein
MKRFLGTAFTLVLMAVAAGAALMWSGVVSVAANDPHLPVTQWILDTGRIRSIKMHAAGIVSPGNLADRARVVGGTAHFAEHCAGCHSAPGVGAEDMAEGMYPKPPALTEAARRWTPGELFWILKNGIKMSGMPSWADHGDEALWDIVAFLEKLPGMNEQNYGQLVMASMKAGGHHMHGAGIDMGAMPAQPAGSGAGEAQPSRTHP